MEKHYCDRCKQEIPAIEKGSTGRYDWFKTLFTLQFGSKSRTVEDGNEWELCESCNKAMVAVVRYYLNPQQEFLPVTELAEEQKDTP